MKTESKVSYDDRRKVLVHTTNTEEDAKSSEGKTIGQVTTVMTGTYGEEGIRSVYKNLQQDIIGLEQGLKKNKEQLGALKEIEEDEDVKKVKALLEKINKLKQKEQLENQKKEFEERLKFSKKSYVEIKGAIGSRLKL